MLEAVDDLYLQVMLGCVHEQKAHGQQWVQLIGVANKKQCLRRSLALLNDLKHSVVSLSTILTTLLRL
jgi:hypothetical protein